MKSPIEQEIEWCESHRGYQSKEFEDGFLAGLKQSLLISRVKSTPIQEILYYCSHCERDTLTIDDVCLWCGHGKE